MFKKLLLLTILVLTTISCQFTETLVLNEDGSGRMAIQMDLSEMMAFSGEMGTDSTMVKSDTIISFKDILEEKKDSIATLTKAEQKRLKAMENYNIHLVTDPETNTMIMDIFVDFKDIAEANDLMAGFNQADGVMPGSKSNEDEGDKEKEPDIIGVKYSFKKGVFKRDAFIKDKMVHRQQIDSMKQAEAFLGEAKYTLKYTFPKKIKSASVEDAMFSLDGKTIEVRRSFMEYLKNPDVLDLEVKLED